MAEMDNNMQKWSPRSNNTHVESPNQICTRRNSSREYAPLSFFEESQTTHHKKQNKIAKAGANSAPYLTNPREYDDPEYCLRTMQEPGVFGSKVFYSKDD